MFKSTFGISIIVVIFLASLTLATEFQVLDFQEDPMDMRGTVRPYKDMNADLCAVLRVESDVQDDLNLTDVTVYHRDKESAGVYYFYVSYLERHVTFASKGYLPLTYKIPRQLTKGKVYKVRIQSVGLINGEEKAKGLLEIEIDSGEIWAEIDNAQIGFVTVPANEILELKLNSGSHEVVLRRAGFREFRSQVDIVQGEVKRLPVTLKSDRRQEKMVQTETGILVVRSTPKDASVYIDGIKVGTTTHTAKKIETGEHLVEIEKARYQRYSEQVNVTFGCITNVETILEPDYAKLSIKSTPPRCQIFINDQPVGFTPYEVEQLSGTYKLRLTQYPFHDLEQEFVIEPTQDKKLNLELKPAFGSIRITSDPSEAAVILNGQDVGSTPFIQDTVLTGDYSLSIFKDLHKYYEVNLAVEDGEQTNHHATLDPNFGTLIVKSEPSEKSLYVNDKYVGNTPLTSKLEPAMYKVTISDDLYDDFVKNEEIEILKTSEINANLIRKTGSVTVFTEPPDAEIYFDRKYIGISPNIIKDYPTGQYSLRIKSDGFTGYESEINIEEGLNEDINVRLSSLGEFNILSIPTGAEIFLNEELIGKTPIRASDLNEDIYTVKAEKEGYMGKTKKIKSKLGISKKVKFHLYDKVTYKPSFESRRLDIDIFHVELTKLGDSRISKSNNRTEYNYWNDVTYKESFELDQQEISFLWMIGESGNWVGFWGPACTFSSDNVATMYEIKLNFGFRNQKTLFPILETDLGYYWGDVNDFHFNGSLLHLSIGLGLNVFHYLDIYAKAGYTNYADTFATAFIPVYKDRDTVVWGSEDEDENVTFVTGKFFFGFGISLLL